MPRASVMMHEPISLQQAEEMLEFVSPDCDRDSWVRIGMALHAEFGDAAFDTWDRWSQGGQTYDKRACRASWRGFRARPGGIGIGTLIKAAQDHGYELQRTRTTPEQRQAMRAEMQRRRAQRIARAQAEMAERSKAAHAARVRGLQLWQAAAKEGDSPYAKRKGLQRPESVRYQANGTLVVPMLRYDFERDQALQGVQTIAPSGKKWFPYGTAKQGAACRLGLAVVGEPVFICEGWATGMSLRMAMELGWGARRWPVFVAFDAGNLPLVCEVVHEQLPSSPIVICADDDHATVISGKPYNTGLIQAQVAQQSVMDAGCRLVVRSHPYFRPGTPRKDGDTDFNDLHRLEGLQTVADQLRIALDCIEEVRSYG